MRHTAFLGLLLAVGLPIGAQQIGMRNPAWLRQALFYQIYPSSFMDSDGNGIGDLPGIISRLDYVERLGVNAIWLNPCYESGWVDGGYDVIDFYKVDPRFGTNSDLKRLVDEAHKRGIKVCLDLVAGHSSNRCEWFLKSSCGDRNDHFSDYYIWTDTIPESERRIIEERKKTSDPQAGTLGNFVEADAPRGKYYQKNYYPCQPAFNYGYAHPVHSWEQPVTAPGPQAMRRELRNIMAFWFDKGVDGFRVDMAPWLVKNDPNWTETKKLWQEIRAWVSHYYPDRVLISEWGSPKDAIPAGFDIDFMLHTGVQGYETLFFARDTPWGKPMPLSPNANKSNYEYCYFDKSGKGSLDTFVKNYTDCLLHTRQQGYIAIPTSNHDFQRPNVGTRNSAGQLRVAMTFFLTMPGIPFIYYGDEIGMKYQTGLPDKEGSSVRAGSRTPMQWAPGPTAGFSSCNPASLYLPVDTEGGRITVAEEENDPQSILNYTRRLISLHKAVPALGNTAEWELVSSLRQPYPMVYRRRGGGQTCIVAINPSDKKVEAVLPHMANKVKLLIVTGKGKYACGRYDRITLYPESAAVFKVM